MHGLVFDKMYVFKLASHVVAASLLQSPCVLPAFPPPLPPPLPHLPPSLPSFPSLPSLLYAALIIWFVARNPAHGRLDYLLAVLFMYVLVGETKLLCIVKFYVFCFLWYRDRVSPSQFHLKVNPIMWAQYPSRCSSVTKLATIRWTVCWRLLIKEEKSFKENGEPQSDMAIAVS